MKRILAGALSLSALVCCTGGSDLGQGTGTEGTGEATKNESPNEPSPGGENKTPVTSGDTSSSSSSSSASSSGSTSSSGSSGTTEEQHPECAAYGSTYCKCLGTAAAPDCVKKITDNCNDYWSYCTMQKQAKCVVTQNCAKGWVDTCAKEKC